MEEAAEESGESRKWISRVALSSALLAVVAAICALLAGHHESEALLDQMKASDQWAYYQAKGIKSSLVESRAQVLDAVGKPPGDQVKALEAKYEAEQKQIEEKGKELEESSESHMGHHVQFARGVTVFQIAIAMGAIAVLAKRPKLWLVSIGLGVIGLVFFILGLL